MNGQFIKVPYTLLDSKVSNECKWVYMALMHYRNGNHSNIKVSLEKLSKVAGIRSRQLSNHLGALCRAEIISRKQSSYGAGEFDCNTYTIECDEMYFAKISWDIAFSSELKASFKIAYCMIKRHMNLNRDSFTCYMRKEELATLLQCSENQVDKIKRTLKQAGFIEFERGSNKIVSSYERNVSIEKVLE